MVAPTQLVQHRQHLRRGTSVASCPVHKHRRHRGCQVVRPPKRRCVAALFAIAWAPIVRQHVAHGRKPRAVEGTWAQMSTWNKLHQLRQGPARPTAGQQTQHILVQEASTVAARPARGPPRRSRPSRRRFFRHRASRHGHTKQARTAQTTAGSPKTATFHSSVAHAARRRPPAKSRSHP